MTFPQVFAVCFIQCIQVRHWNSFGSHCISITAKHNLELDQMDIPTAYRNGELEEELYLQSLEDVPIQPRYYIYCSLYRLKQAGWTWNKTLDKKLGELDFIHLDAEKYLYVLQKLREVCFLVVYVDDSLLAASSRSYMNSVKDMLSSSFKIHDLDRKSVV